MFTASNRENILKEMSSYELDVLVIGGGTTGAGIALDGASRGMKIGLVDMQDFGAGTSSRSTKLVHGGLRYLQSFEVKLVHDVGTERRIVYENGPHVTIPERMLLPVYKYGMFNNRWIAAFGISVYDFLANVKKGERRELFNKKQTLELIPFLKEEGLKGSCRYVEYKTDDGRLTIEVMKKAYEYGALVCNYAKVVELIYKDNKVKGAKIIDQISNNEYIVYAKKIINAAGPWVDDIRKLDNSLQGKHLFLTKGVHLVFDKKTIPLNQAVYFDVSDGRMVFAIPRGDKVYVGTTDTPFKGDKTTPKISSDDRKYLIEAINFVFKLDVTEKDILSSWSGIRPLIYKEGKSPSEISRKDEVWVSKNGLISIAGGKLTGYRKMAEDILNKVSKMLKKEYDMKFNKCVTKNIPISGGGVGGSVRFQEFITLYIKKLEEKGFDRDIANKLIRLYGSNIKNIVNEIDDYEEHAKISGLPIHITISLVYGINNEMIVSIDDFFSRRYPSLLFNIDEVLEFKYKVIDYMGELLNWDDVEKDKQDELLANSIDIAVTPN